MYRIFIVEDDDKIGELLRRSLVKYGFEARVAARMHELKKEMEEWEPHLILLDIHLPHYDGYYWCRQFRTATSAPIIFVSARSGEMDQVMAIENGGDDYVTKPIPLDLLLAKIKGLLRRAYGEYAAVPAQQAPGEGELHESGLRLHPARSELEWDGRLMALTKNECLLAECLLKHEGRVVGRERLLETLWDDVQFVDDNTLTVNVTRLRRKLEELGLPGVIETVRGSGYKLNMKEAGA
ncbi:response regulator transcription factor [Paenibacillus methanolicus]|uniref:DNA-binding response OmpR family regulator n=1 Tax=Paenibacillus methanolicus TaxID=582686 RepID=A0A5S5BYN8_9BACL|nr:response regulator transcription factor [Paenibacillus methanolicus]TYP71322.1 DNA-binding response OmpR family regulator [Paenibacillus methanolicus]